MVAKSNTIVEPVAMVVKSVDAFVADEAVPRLLWPEDLASWADEGWVKVLVQLQEGDALRLFDVTGVTVACDEKEDVCEDKVDDKWLGIAF